MIRLLIFLAMLGPLIANGQVEKRIDSRISDVTVFLNRAQVTRLASVRMEAGKTNLVVHGLTSQLDPQSIQVAGKGKFTILGISHQQNYISEFNMPQRLKTLKDSIQLLEDQIRQIQTNKEISNKEEQLILGNQKIGGANQNLTVQELKAMADFFRNRLAEISELRMKYDKQLTRLNEVLARVRNQFREQNELTARNTSDVIISVASDAPTSAEMEIRYVVNNAGWTPVYDLRAVDTKSPVQLLYKANVYQRTGEEWKNVKLVLSTGNPSLGGTKPELSPWYLSFYRPVVRAPVLRNLDKAKAAPSAEAGYAMLEKAETVADYTEVVQTSLNTQFAISIPYTVSSSGKATLVDIANHAMKASYDYYCTPKLDADAFLVASVTNWEEYNLLPAEANVFMEGTFVGKTNVDPNQIRDTLMVSLGRDKRIVVTREKVKDFSARRSIGSNQRDTYAYEISVRNTRNEPVVITIEDQIPVSQNSQIEVTLTDPAGAKYIASSGKMEWRMTLKPQEQRKLIYKFEVKYPKDQIVSGL